MEEIKTIEVDVDKRIEEAIQKSMITYFARLENGFIGLGLEKTFQMSIAEIIKQILELNTFSPDERFIVLLEINKPINHNKDYIDIVIKYEKKEEKREYLIELKYKKITDYAFDFGNIESYIDIFNLEFHKNKTPNVCGCYFIFLTDHKTYLNKGRRGTRVELPMYDGYTIQKNCKYAVTGKSAKSAARKYNNGFTFSKDYVVNYIHAKACNKDFWYYILKI